MTTRKYSSRSQQSTLTGSVTSGATSITVVSGTGLLGGVTIPAGTTFTLVIDPDTAIEEIVDATAVSTNTFTITRAIDGSSAQDHSAGAVVRHMAIGRDYRDANLHAEASAYYNDGSGTGHTMHGISSGEGDVVGTAKTQTLTNKTLTSPTISNPTFTGTPQAEASIVFEGATADAYETTLTVVDPTQDNTITLPNTTGTVVIANAVQTLTNKTMGDALNAGGFKITNLATPTAASDAVRKDFADAQVAAAATSAASAATSASSAATSASSALTSANSASTSASSALTSANSAATSASTMAASVAAAATSAASAATSASSAATSATAAATSATSAAASATAATTSATSAAASATAAATSATSAAASATASATSASASATSATAAATSATSAAASATAAATSATNAAASATAAATSATSAALSYTTFNDQYLGAKSSAPTLNNSGGALVSGNLYFNTSDSTLYVYNVSTWQAAAVSTAGFAITGSNTFTGNQLISVNSSGNALEVRQIGSGNAFVVEDSANPDSTPFVIDSSGNVGIGGTPTNAFQIYRDGALVVGLFRYSTDTSPVNIFGYKSRGTAASPTTVASGDGLVTIQAHGYDGASNITAGSIQFVADGTVSTGIVPGRIVFSTTNTSGTGVERMRIINTGEIGIGVTPTVGRTLEVRKSLTGATSATSIFAGGIIQSDVTSQANMFTTFPATQAASFVLANLVHYNTSFSSLGASSSIGTQIGFNAANFTQATTNIGFNGGLAANGSAAFNAYMQGTAPNYFAGQTTVGSTSLTLGSGSVAQQFGVVSTSASNIVEVIRGAASQTGDLTQWQNSAGTILSRIDGSGTAYLATATIIGGSDNGYNLSQWQETTGDFAGNIASYALKFKTGNNTARTERMRIDSSGNIFIGTNTTAGQNTGGITIQGKDIELMTLMGAY